MRTLQRLPNKLKIKILFSSKIIYIGLFILAIPSIILIGFLPNTDFLDSKYNNSPTEVEKGILISINETNCSVNENRVFVFGYEFYNDKELIKGKSYGINENFNPGDSVDIEYLSNNSMVSRIIGTKNGAFDLSTLIFLFGFVITGLLILIIPIFQKINLIKILKSGFEILSTNLQQELKIPTFPTGKSNSFYRLKFGYDINRNSYSKIIYLLTDENSIRRIRMSSVLVDMHNPSKSFIIEALPIDAINYILDKCTIANIGS